MHVIDLVVRCFSFTLKFAVRLFTEGELHKLNQTVNLMVNRLVKCRRIARDHNR